MPHFPTSPLTHMWESFVYSLPLVLGLSRHTLIKRPLNRLRTQRCYSAKFQGWIRNSDEGTRACEGMRVLFILDSLFFPGSSVSWAGMPSRPQGELKPTALVTKAMPASLRGSDAHTLQ